MSSDRPSQRTSRRAFLATVGAAALAGCAASGSQTSSTTTATTATSETTTTTTSTSDATTLETVDIQFMWDGMMVSVDRLTAHDTLTVDDSELEAGDDKQWVLMDVFVPDVESYDTVTLPELSQWRLDTFLGDITTRPLGLERDSINRYSANGRWSKTYPRGGMPDGANSDELVYPLYTAAFRAPEMYAYDLELVDGEETVLNITAEMPDEEDDNE